MDLRVFGHLLQTNQSLCTGCKGKRRRVGFEYLPGTWSKRLSFGPRREGLPGSDKISRARHRAAISELRTGSVSAVPREAGIYCRAFGDGRHLESWARRTGAAPEPRRGAEGVSAQSHKPLKAGKRLKIPHSRPTLGPKEARAAASTVRGGFVGYGPQARELELRLRKRTGRRFAFALPSGWHALVLALKALDLPRASLVALPVLTCGSVLSAVVNAGHRAFLTD